MKPVTIPRIRRNYRDEPNRLMCTWYPGDMDKIGGQHFAIVNDAILAHRMNEWYVAFREMLEAGADCTDENALYDWQVQARMLINASKEFM